MADRRSEKTRLKVCGVTNLSDARRAIECGASYIGLIFVRESPRCVSPGKAREITAALKGLTKFVGVFKDAEPDDINGLSDLLELDFVQCHGRENAALVSEIAHPVIKAVEIAVTMDAAALNAAAQAFTALSNVAYLLFDRPKGVRSPQWLSHAVGLLSACGENLEPYFFAGGLTDENLPGVVGELHPHALDVASGIEISPGLKDHVKLERFCRALEDANNRSKINLSASASEVTER